jgi:hypothetical protein
MHRAYALFSAGRMGACSSVICFTLLFVLAPSYGLAKKLPKPGVDDKVELSLVVKAIDEALTESAQYPVTNFPRLKSVTVSVNTTVSKNVGGKLTLYVFNVGAAGTIDNTASLTFQLKPPPPPKPEVKPQSVNPEDIKNALVKQIQAAKLGFVDTTNASGLLRTNDVQLEIGFAVTKEISGGVDTGKILPIGIGASGKYSSKSANSIKLDFSDD